MALVACAALLVVSIGAGALVHVVQRGTGATTAPIQERAWFQRANIVSHGVTVLAPIHFVVVPTTDRAVTWVASDGHRVYQRGIAQGTPGSNVVVTLATSTLKPNTWLTIEITGILAPLKAWVT